MSKKLFSFFMAILLGLNCFPFAVVADFEGNNSMIKISSESVFYDKIQVPVNTAPKKIIVKPTITSIYYGQKVPDVIPCEVEDQNISDVNVTVKLIQNGNEYRFDDPVCDNSDYVAELADGCTFKIKEYSTDETADIENEAEIYHVRNIKLKAPQGFSIGLDENNFGEFVTAQLYETENDVFNEIFYYLRNESDQIGAISTRKTYQYKCSLKPQIVKAEIRTANSEDSLNFKDFGIVTKDDFILTITAQGNDSESETVIYLNHGSKSERKVADVQKHDDGLYYYSAKFPINTENVNAANFIFTAYAENTFGASIEESIKITDETGNFVNNYDNQNRVILDKVTPKKPDIKITYHNHEGYVEANGIISDSESGIKTIEYKWGESYHQYGIKDGIIEYDQNPDAQINFSVKVDYDDLDNEKYPYKLYLKITDNAGNVNELPYEYFESENGRDTIEPEITDIGFRKKGCKQYDKSVNFTKFGNYANEDIELVVTARDRSETTYTSGIDHVSLFDRGNSQFKAITVIKPVESHLNNEGHFEYVLEIPVGTKIEDMWISVSDGDNYTYADSVLEVIKNNAVNFNEEQRNYYSLMKSNSLAVENKSPKVTYDTSNCSEVVKNDDETVYWYNKNGGNFFVNISDIEPGTQICSGIAGIKITDEYNGTTEVLDDRTFTEKQENVYTFSSDISKLSNGIHYIKVEVTDNAGNLCDNFPTVQVIGVDMEAPVGKISVEGPNSVDISGKKWFDKDQIIKFRVDADPDVSGIKDITLYINGIKKNFSQDEIDVSENGYCIKADTTDIPYNGEHKYVLTGNITDVAGNYTEIDAYTVYIDCERPYIKKFTVEKKSSALDKILNVLSFGTYSNDNLIFKAYVYDADFDSGIDCVKIKYDGLDKQELMTDEGNGVYSYVISKNTEIFQSDIVVTAYDKYGKTSLNCPSIEKAEQGKGVSDSVFAMIETEKPKVTIGRPKGDGIERTDKQIWFNSNKNISISVYDKDSGIRNVDIRVNGIDVTADKKGTIIPKISTTESAKKRDNERHIYAFDTDYFTEIAGKSQNGKYTVTVEVIDNAGNVNSEESFTYYIDRKSPIVDSFEFVPKTSDNINETSEYIERLEYGFYFKKDFIANIHVEDSQPSSGLNKIKYRLVSYDDGEFKDEATGEVNIVNGLGAINIPAKFKGQIFVKACDNVGNYSQEETPKAFVSDNIAPEINVSRIGSSRYNDENGNKILVDDVSITVTITDTKSGIKEIGYFQDSEKDSFDRRVISVDGSNATVDSEIGDGWLVTQMDANLVTQVTKTFIFDKDNNDITLNFDAADNSGNISKDVQSETFTVDKTDPIINVDINSGVNNTIYYNAKNRAVITINVIERNFDADLIQTTIENAYNGNIPDISFQDLSATEHRAVVTFSEGDYSFDIKGTDLGGHSAKVNMDYEKVRRFYVDETAPTVEENFDEFVYHDKDNYLNTKKTAVIKVTEHNFNPNRAGLKILKKDAGKKHTEDELSDVTYSMTSMGDWKDENDTHILKITFDEDAVYRIEISPSDLSGNTSDSRSSEIFEIDTTLPVVSAKNGSVVDKKNAENFLDIYPYERKDETVPSVEFTDVNFDHLEYSLTVYMPEYTNGKELSEVKPVSVYLDSDKEKLGTLDKKLFTLPAFDKDGVYALELTAVDKAGNKSVLNSNTYMRMVDSDVLAYIPNSNAANKTGWYSFQYENGTPISKRPDNFSDIDIVVLAKNDSNIDIVLRDYNGDEKSTNLQAQIDNSMYGVRVDRYTLKSDYFKENFQEDTDTELYLSVKNESGRIDLGQMHIDNIPPSCTLPADLKSWNWYFGNDSRTITITNISELLEKNKCKVYDNGKEVDFVYSETEGNLSFTLNSGWHNVGITLEDAAGNTYSIQEVDNIYIGYFWLWIIIIASIVFIGIILLLIYIVRKRRYS